MALTYTIAGAAFAAAGQQAQAFFQQPWIIITFAALAVIGQSGDVVRGALALFAMAIGMGSPLLLVGVAGGRFLPHAGPWMTTIKTLFGVLFLAVAVWMLERILPGSLTLALWALLVIVGGYYFGGFGRHAAGTNSWRLIARGAGLAAVVWGVIMLVGAAAGGHDPLQPLRGAALPGLGTGGAPVGAEELPVRKVATIVELDNELAAAETAGQPVMLDFYADWCVSCKEMEKYTFSVAGVQQDLAGFVLLKADVTANNDADQALLRRFGVYGPPTTAFFGSHGRECRGFRLVGFVAADDFRDHHARFAREC
jgi:thiol:disulfide interchange protein DsbD